MAVSGILKYRYSVPIASILGIGRQTYLSKASAFSNPQVFWQVKKKKRPQHIAVKKEDGNLTILVYFVYLVIISHIFYCLCYLSCILSYNTNCLLSRKASYFLLTVSTFCSILCCSLLYKIHSMP